MDEKVFGFRLVYLAVGVLVIVVLTVVLFFYKTGKLPGMGGSKNPGIPHTTEEKIKLLDRLAPQDTEPSSPSKKDEEKIKILEQIAPVQGGAGTPPSLSNEEKLKLLDSLSR